MPMIVVLAALCVLRYFEVWRFAGLSWWWIIGLAVLAFLYFEFLEPMLGLDRRKAHNEDARRRQARIKQTFDKK